MGDLVVLKDPGNRDNYLVRRVVAATEGDEMVSTDKTDNPFFIDKDQCWVLAQKRKLKPNAFFTFRQDLPSMNKMINNVFHLCLFFLSPGSVR